MNYIAKQESKKYLEELREEIIEGSAPQEIGIAVQSGTIGNAITRQSS